MRKAFNLMMAIGMILVLSGAAILTMKYVSISAQHITDSYVKEQAEIFAKSVLEAALLKVEGYDRSTNNDCLTDFSTESADGRFLAKVYIRHYYLYNGEDNDGTTLDNCSIDENISTNESHGYVIVEVVVTTNDSHAKIKGFVTPVRVVLRSLQRP